MKENITRIGLFKKPEALSVEEFRDYWHYHHAPIATNMVGMKKYNQNHVIKAVDLGLAPVNDRECLGMSKIWFGSMDNQKGNDPETMRRLAIDEKHLFREMDLVVCSDTTHKAMPGGVPFVKYLCLFRRKPELSEEDFRAKWAEAAELALKIPGLIGYNENVVLERVYNDIQGEKRYPNVDYDQVPIDGVAEFYFEFTEAAIENPFDSAEGKAFCEATNAILMNSANYMMNEYQIMTVSNYINQL